MNRFGLGYQDTPIPVVHDDDHKPPLLTLAYLHYWG